MEEGSDIPDTTTMDGGESRSSSPPFFGFGPETKIQGPLLINSGGGDITVTRGGRRGRQRGVGEGNEKVQILETRTRNNLGTNVIPSSSVPKKSGVKSSASRAKMGTEIRVKPYLVEKVQESLSFKKLPKCGAVLECFLASMSL